MGEKQPLVDLEDLQAEQRDRMNKAGESGDKNSLLVHYKDIADKYDKFKTLSGWMDGRTAIASALHKVMVAPNARILDCGAGTGQTAEQVINFGYTNIDGLDMSMEMLKVAKGKGIFQHILCDTIDGAHQTKILDDTYDAVICNGTFMPGQMDQTCFPELTRITKSSGYIIFSVSSKYLNEWKLFQNGQLDKEIQRNISSGTWKDVKQENRPYWRGEECAIYTVTV